MNELSAIAMVTAFAAGIVSFLSPCVLPLVPGYVSYMAGYSLRDVQNPADVRAKAAALAASVFFVLGFSTVFVALGASATALGQFLLKYRYEANIVGGAIVVVFGLLTTGLVKIPIYH
jgi:cytochrome c-type biogenesis protein